MRVVLSGASGLIGSALVSALRAEDHEVIRLVRRDAEGADERGWDPAAGVLDSAHLQGVDAIVNLSGANLDRRWTARAKREILESRTMTTALLAAASAELKPGPKLKPSCPLRFQLPQNTVDLVFFLHLGEAILHASGF